MKEIKTSKYLKKRAIYGDFPVGDPGLPDNLTERDIPGGVEPNEINDRVGETEVEVNWPEFSQWFEEGGEPLPEVFKIRMRPTAIWILYQYSYDYNENNANNIKIIKIKDYETEQILTDSYLLESFREYFDGQIRNDIEEGENDTKLERTSDYNMLEE